jgi:Zn-dependent protease with chaperone function
MTLYLLIALSWFLVGLALVTLRIVNEREPEAQWRLLLAAAATPFLLFPLAGVCRVALEQMSLLVPGLDSPVPLVAVTGAGAALAVGRIVRIRRGQRALLASCQFPEPEVVPALSGHLTELSRMAGLRRAPRVVICPRGASVCVLGFRRPTIVISRDVLTVLGDQELRAVLAHEIAHIRRRDYFLNWLGVVLRAVLFYLPPWPVAWQVLAEVREHRADRLAAAYTADPLTLASALIKVWRYTPGRLAPGGAVGLLARPGRLEARIRRLLEPPPGRPFWRTAVTGVVLGGGLLLAQTTVDAGTHFLARVSPAIRDREACCDPEVSPFPHCVPSRRVFLPRPTTECSRAWAAGPVAKTGIV